MCLCTCDACSVQISSFVSQMLVDHVRLIEVGSFGLCLYLALSFILHHLLGLLSTMKTLLSISGDETLVGMSSWELGGRLCDVIRLELD